MTINARLAEKLRAAIADGPTSIKLPANVFVRAVEESGTTNPGLLKAAAANARHSGNVIVDTKDIEHLLNPSAKRTDPVDAWEPGAPRVDIGAFGGRPPQDELAEATN